MEVDLSEPIVGWNNYIDSDDEENEKRIHDWHKLYRYPWKENKHTLRNIFDRLGGYMKMIRDELGPFEFTIKPSNSLDWVLMKSFSGRWYFGLWNKKTKQREGVGISVNPYLIYKGYWKNNMTHGKGREIYASGGYYMGDFKDGEFDGKGLYRKIWFDFKTI